jgi:Phage Tail Collar Domain
MSDPFIGMIRLVGFNFAPVGWVLCQGQPTLALGTPAAAVRMYAAGSPTGGASAALERSSEPCSHSECRQ